MEKFINLLQSIFIHELFLLITVSPIVLIQFMNVDSSIQTYDLIKSNPSHSRRISNFRRRLSGIFERRKDAKQDVRET